MRRISWRIPEKQVQAVLRDADIVCLNDIKTVMHFNLAGFVRYSSGGDKMHRSGCCVMIRDQLHNELLQLDSSNHDMVCLRLKLCPNILFVAWYIPPSDSPYFSLDAVAHINSLVQNTSGHEVVIIGEVNSRYADLPRVP